MERVRANAALVGVMATAVTAVAAVYMNTEVLYLSMTRSPAALALGLFTVMLAITAPVLSAVYPRLSGPLSLALAFDSLGIYSYRSLPRSNLVAPTDAYVLTYWAARALLRGQDPYKPTVAAELLKNSTVSVLFITPTVNQSFVSIYDYPPLPAVLSALLITLHAPIIVAYGLITSFLLPLSAWLAVRRWAPELSALGPMATLAFTPALTLLMPGGEPYLVYIPLIILAIAYIDRKWASAALLAVAFNFEQFSWLILPPLLALQFKRLGVKGGIRWTVYTLALTAAIMSPFIAWGPRAFIDNVLLPAGALPTPLSLGYVDVIYLSVPPKFVIIATMVALLALSLAEYIALGVSRRAYIMTLLIPLLVMYFYTRGFPQYYYLWLLVEAVTVPALEGVTRSIPRADGAKGMALAAVALAIASPLALMFAPALSVPSAQGIQGSLRISSVTPLQFDCNYTTELAVTFESTYPERLPLSYLYVYSSQADGAENPIIFYPLNSTWIYPGFTTIIFRAAAPSFALVPGPVTVEYILGNIIAKASTIVAPPTCYFPQLSYALWPDSINAPPGPGYTPIMWSYGVNYTPIGLLTAGNLSLPAYYFRGSAAVVSRALLDPNVTLLLAANNTVIPVNANASGLWYLYYDGLELALPRAQVAGIALWQNGQEVLVVPASLPEPVSFQYNNGVTVVEVPSNSTVTLEELIAIASAYGLRLKPMSPCLVVVFIMGPHVLSFDTLVSR